MEYRWKNMHKKKKNKVWKNIYLNWRAIVKTGQFFQLKICWNIRLNKLAFYILCEYFDMQDNLQRMGIIECEKVLQNLLYFELQAVKI